MREKILNYISENGPTLPVDIVKLTGGDSLISNAYLSELVSSKEILKSDELVGTANIYYLPGQEDKLKNKLTELIDFKKTPKNFQTKKVVETPELIKRREEFNNRLKLIEEREKKEKIIERPRDLIKKIIEIPKKLPSIEENKTPLNDAEKIIEKPRDILNKIVKKVKPTLNKNNYDNGAASLYHSAITFLENSNEIISKNMIDENSGTCIIKVKSSVGPIKFYVNIVNKKRLTKSDIAEKYAESIEKKMPVIIITNATIANTSKKYLKELGGFVRVKKINV
tara:strand:- start:1824 stop:2669 length:846 start_codon:yes stop_codon:yes gene_type:complete